MQSESGCESAPDTRTEEEFLRRFADTHPDVFFIQVGAHDGQTDDHLHPFIVQNRWRGILVEPVPELFDRLVATYEGHDGLIFERKAVAAVEGPRPFYRVRHDDRMPHWYDQIGSLHSWFPAECFRAEIPEIDSLLVTETVECVTLGALTARHAVSRIDLVLIDTEGYDYEVLMQLDLASFRPDLIIYEHKNLQPDELRESRRLLERHGYRLTQLRDNIVAVPE